MFARLFSRTRPDAHPHAQWNTGYGRVPQLKWDGELAQIQNFRNFRYQCDGTHDACYETREFDVSTVSSIDFIVVPFLRSTYLAHTMMSFGFEDGRHLVVSVEARLQNNQRYSIWKGLLGCFPIIYVIADERDAIGYRIECRGDEVYLYHVNATKPQLQKFLRGVLQRAGNLAERDERYNTLWNNCATNIRHHINTIWPGRVPWGWGVLMPGRADYLAHRLGLLKSDETFQQTRERARINDLAAGNWRKQDFSRLIRPNRV